MITKKGSEDYLRVILELQQEKKIVKSIDISKKLRVSKPSVSEMLNKMKKQKLIEFEPYSNINLTNKGEKLARVMQNKHEIIEKFAQKLQASNAHEEAHNLEHHFSGEFLKKISEFTEGKRFLQKEMPSYIS